MKLFKVPSNTWVFPTETPKIPPGAPQVYDYQRILFHKIDGAYSLCEMEDGTVCHMGSTTEVELARER